MEKRFSRFSVPLGLLDYINPILYSITMVTITRKLFSVMGHPSNIIFLIGAIMSVFFGLIIPTGKVLVAQRNPRPRLRLPRKVGRRLRYLSIIYES